MGKRIVTEPTPAALRVVDGSDERPEIELTFEMSDVVDKAADALSYDSEIYQRAGSLVHVIVPTSASIGSKSMPTIRELPIATLRTRLAQCARWIKWSQKDDKCKRVNVPNDIVQAIHSRGEWSRVRPLVGVITAPTIRQDGTLLQSSGYDPPTGLLYWPDDNFATIDEDQRPTIDDARRAAESILDIVCDVPFLGGAGKDTPDRSVWLSSVLTLVGRVAIDGCCPLFAFDGNSRGVGKTQLVDVASILAFGVKAPRGNLSNVDEEMRKQITAILKAGKALTLLDNQKSGGKIGGPAFDALLTGTEWEDRELGKLALVKVPARTVWIATGTNMAFMGDLVRRALRSRIQSPLEKPEDKEGFRWGKDGEWLGNVAKRRKILVTQALTILRAHALAGYPVCGGTWGSFGEWTRTIAAPIRWMGFADPLLARVTEDASADEDLIYTHALIGALASIGVPVSSKLFVTTLYPRDYYDSPEVNDPHPTFAPARETLEAATKAKGIPSPASVGALLGRLRGRVVGGMAIVGVADQHTKVMQWSASRVLAGSAIPVVPS